MYNTINNEDDARNQKLNEELYLKYSLQEIDSDILVKKYQYASKSMKKILLLGGAGTMGSEAAKLLLERSDAKLTIADYSAKGLKRVEAELGNRVQTPRARFGGITS